MRTEIGMFGGFWVGVVDGFRVGVGSVVAMGFGGGCFILELIVVII